MAAASVGPSPPAPVSRTVSGMRKTSGAVLGKSRMCKSHPVFVSAAIFLTCVLPSQLLLLCRLSETRSGDICNACVLLVKRWKKLPVGTKKNWNHVSCSVHSRDGVFYLHAYEAVKSLGLGC